MIHFRHFFARRNKRDVDLGDVLLDSVNLPAYDALRGEGRAAIPLPESSYRMLMGGIALVCVLLGGRVGMLSLVHGAEYRAQAEANRLDAIPVFSERGAFLDRNGVPLVSNIPSSDPSDKEFSQRVYIDRPGYGHLLGFVSLPKKDASGFFYRHSMEGKAGVESVFDELVRGVHGKKLIEVDAMGKVQSENVYEPPKNGTAVTLSVDTRVEDILFSAMRDHIEKIPFQGGAAAIMEIHTGEIIAYASYPEYEPQPMTEGDTGALARYHSDARAPFLDRVTKGLYAPGSIVKPFLALEALDQGVITPDKEIYSSGSISVPNPYDPEHPSIFRDWKAHGATDMRRAIAVSSDVYFYAIGGGIPGQRGMGIVGIEQGLSRFGFGATVPFPFENEAGVLPTPEWKARHFEDGTWRLGDTYHSAIGQFGTLVTPLQVLRAVAALADEGILRDPILIKDAPSTSHRITDVSPAHIAVVREGMKLAAEPGYTAAALKLWFTDIAAKTGTAEVGPNNSLVNSWVMGFWPYDAPRYAFVMVLEKGPVKNLYGSPGVMRTVLEEMHEAVPEYFQ